MFFKIHHKTRSIKCLKCQKNVKEVQTVSKSPKKVSNLQTL